MQAWAKPIGLAPCDDQIWYLFDDIVSLIPTPQNVMLQHVEIHKDVWAELTEKRRSIQSILTCCVYLLQESFKPSMFGLCLI